MRWNWNEPKSKGQPKNLNLIQVRRRLEEGTEEGEIF